MAFDPVTAIRIIDAGMRAVSLATRALEASNNGDEQAANAYLKEARTHYASARKTWDEA